MKTAKPTRTAIWSRIVSFLKKVDASLPLISPFATRPNGRAYRVFLNGRTILIERPGKSQPEERARQTAPTA